MRVNTSEIVKTCRELEEARRDKKISQDILDYELAKLTLEFVEDYRPKQKPSMGEEVHAYTTMTKEERRRLTPEETENLKLKVKRWRDSFSNVEFDNKSNRLWLEKCFKSLEANANPSSFRVKMILNEFGDM